MKIFRPFCFVALIATFAALQKHIFSIESSTMTVMKSKDTSVNSDSSSHEQPILPTSTVKQVDPAFNMDDSPSDSPPKDILILVQGPESVFTTWYDRIREVSGTFNGDYGNEQVGDISLIYASYDKPINEPNCKWAAADSFSCRTLFVPNTTWTQGRNLLVHAAGCAEQQRGQKYLFWVFSDDDAELFCKIPGRNFPHGVPCWRRYFRLLQNEAYPGEIPILAHVLGLPTNRQSPKFIFSYMASNYYDAILNAFHRSYLEYLLPYAFLQPGASEWNSQAAHGFLMQACFDKMAVIPQQFRVTNNKHRDYSRGLNFTQIDIDTRNNFAPYVPHIKTATNRTEIRHFTNATILPNMTAVVDHVKSQRRSMLGHEQSCHSLAKRYHTWMEARKCK